MGETLDSGSRYKNYIEEQALPGPLIADLVGTVLARDASLRFRAGGISMFPFIRDGDVISVTPLAYNQPRLGDVIVFLHAEDEQPIAHRLVDFCDSGYILKGDNYRFGQSDGVIPKTQMLGIVSKIERKGRKVHLGLGIERYGIAWLSRRGALNPLVQMLTALYRPLKSVCKKLFT